MRQIIAILAVAAFWILGFDLLGAVVSTTAPARTKSKSTGSTIASSPSRAAAVETPRRGVSTRARTSSAKRKRASSRARRRRPSPWRISSYSDPAAHDNPASEDRIVREAAIDALGRWNGSVVVVDPNSGRILTIVNQPLAFASGFTPCSNFKPVVALAALKEGVITSDTKLRVGRRLRMDLTEALAHSNNLFFSKLGQQLGFDRVAEYAHQFGLGEKAGYNIPEESPGKFPEVAPKEGGVGLLSSYGRSIEVTPLQMAALISAIANGGTLYYLQYPRSAEELATGRPRGICCAREGRTRRCGAVRDGASGL
ncbi:MAG: hypothetical protein LAN62_06980 [Acidobacteriia bacterium]|nr:hypothetical protein [Terriglobia bacterium]